MSFNSYFFQLYPSSVCFDFSMFLSLHFLHFYLSTLALRSYIHYARRSVIIVITSVFSSFPHFLLFSLFLICSYQNFSLTRFLTIHQCSRPPSSPFFKDSFLLFNTVKSPSFSLSDTYFSVYFKASLINLPFFHMFCARVNVFAFSHLPITAKTFFFLFLLIKFLTTLPLQNTFFFLLFEHPISFLFYFLSHFLPLFLFTLFPFKPTFS